MKTKELLSASEQQVANLKVKLTAASSCESVGTACLKLQLRGKLMQLCGVRSSFQKIIVIVCPTEPSQESNQIDKELQEVKGQLHTTEQKNVELAEQLQNTNANVERYRVVVLTLEETLKREKEVFLKYVNMCVQLDTFVYDHNLKAFGQFKGIWIIT